jgi:DNA-binding transcriptional MerR regulator
MDNDERIGITPSEMAERCGVTMDTLRYYEREGLLDVIDRTNGGQRRYSSHDVAWVSMLRCLRVTAMPIRDMRRFAELVRAGDSEIPNRLELLAKHRATVVQKIEELGVALQMIDHKIEAYASFTAGEAMAPVARSITDRANRSRLTTEPSS